MYTNIFLARRRRNNVYKKVVIFVYNTESSQYLYTIQKVVNICIINITIFLALLTRNIFVSILYYFFVYNDLKK